MYKDNRQRIERPYLDPLLTKKYLEEWKDTVYNVKVREVRQPLLSENRRILKQLKANPPKNKRKKLKAKLEHNRTILKQPENQIIKGQLFTAILYLVDMIIAQQSRHIKQCPELRLHEIDLEQKTYCLLTNNAKIKKGCGSNERSTSWRMTERLKVIGFVTDRKTFNDRDFKLFIDLRFLPFLEEGEAPEAFSFPLLANQPPRLSEEERCKLQAVTLISNKVNPIKAVKESGKPDEQISLPANRTLQKEHKKHGKFQGTPTSQQEDLSDKSEKKEQKARGAAAEMVQPEENEMWERRFGKIPAIKSSIFGKRANTQEFWSAKQQLFLKFWGLVVHMLYAGKDLNDRLVETTQKELWKEYFVNIQTEKFMEERFDTYVEALQKQKDYVAAKDHRFTKWPNQFFVAPPRSEGQRRSLKDMDLSTFHGRLVAMENNRQRKKRRQAESHVYRKEQHYRTLLQKYWENPTTDMYLETSRKVAKKGPEYLDRFYNSVIPKI